MTGAATPTPAHESAVASVTAHHHGTPPERPKTITVKVFEYDSSKPLVEGKNPVPIATAPIDYELRLPRREKAAVAKLAQLFPGRSFDVRHAVDGSMVATVYVKSSASPFELARQLQAGRAPVPTPTNAPPSAVALPPRRSMGARSATVTPSGATSTATPTVQKFPAPARPGVKR